MIKKKKDIIPKIKRKINAFLVGEEGKISKESLIKGGLILGLGSMVVGSVSAAHTNSLGVVYESTNDAVKSTHTSHGSHSSHGSHGSHGNHSDHANHGSHSSHGSHGSHSNHVNHGSHGSHGSHCNNKFCW